MESKLLESYGTQTTTKLLEGSCQTDMDFYYYF